MNFPYKQFCALPIVTLLLVTSSAFAAVETSLEPQTAEVTAQPSEPAEPVAPAEPETPPLPLREPPVLDEPALMETLPEDPRTRLWTTPDPGLHSTTAPLEPIGTPLITPPLPTFIPFRDDPLARSAISQAQTNAEYFRDGLGGIPNPHGAFYIGGTVLQQTGLKLGPVIFQPTISLGANFERTKDDKAKEVDGYGLAAFSVAMRLGDPSKTVDLSLNYGASFRVPGDKEEGSPLDQALSLRGALHLGRLDLGLGVQFTSLSGASRDTGSAVERDLLTVALTSSYQLAPKTRLEWDLTLPVRSFSTGTSSSGFIATNFVTYDYSPKTTIGLGAAFGVLIVEKRTSQTFEQLLARVNYDASRKLRFTITTGLELRQAEEIDQFTPVFGIGLHWKLRERTQFRLSADRRVVNSAGAAASNYTSTSAIATLEQGIGRSFTTSASIGYEHAAYRGLFRDTPNDRVDHYVFGQVGVTARWARHWSSSVVLSAGEIFSTNEDSHFFQAAVLTTYAF